MTWSAGTWTVRLNVTTANMNLTWTDVYICRTSSGCFNSATIGSATGLAKSLGSTGVLSQAVTGAAQTPSAGDKVMIAFVFSNAAMSTQTFNYTPNQLIDSPFVSGDATVNLTGQSATASVGVVTPTYNTSVSLTGQSATASVGTVSVSTATNATVNLTGQSATASVGTVTETYSGQKTLTGQSATASVGTVTETYSGQKTITGQSATASTGTVTPNLAISLSGLAAAASVGAVTPSIGGNITVNLAGLGMTASVGSPTVQINQVVLVDTHDGDNRKRRFRKEIDERQKRHKQLLDVYEAVLEESPQVAIEIAKPYLAEPQPDIPSAPPSINFDAMLSNMAAVERLMQEYREMDARRELDDEEALALLW